MTAPTWLQDAVLYQIYPQSFADSNGDGIGDLRGIAQHLDYLSWLGVTAIWLSPCFVSPMRDAGYDVADYFTVDPRYGDNNDLTELIEQARTRGIRILLDLVPGHTADVHPWFVASANDPGDHRYIWADVNGDGHLPTKFVPSPGTRPGGFLPNFFDIQPALNFGYARQKTGEPWRQSVDSEGPRANRAALRSIMDHWLGLGVSGFRVDMAASLVKDDPGYGETARLWRDVRSWLDRTHPDAVLLSEWGDPPVAVPAGFHADFFLHFGGPNSGLPMRSLWSTATATTIADWGTDPCFFDADARGSASTFLNAYTDALETIGEPGHIALPTANHDFARLRCAPRTPDELPPAFAFHLTFPTLPAIYYGDEIGMRYIPDLPDKEGSVMLPGYNRAGSRTPMQWDASPNAGFSSAPADRIYLPIDPEPERPTVADQRADANSLLHTVKELIALRGAHPEFGPNGSVEILHDGYPLAYLRGGRFLVVVNPARVARDLRHDRPELAGATDVRNTGVSVTQTAIHAEPFSFGIFRLPDESKAQAE
ncbi:MAG TPA: alpha-amylase family glycosyl hydrolase [Jatrophihabitans sp.]|nr:alpha-amylase family glycosyl hydrolase [Jatrophihabitans sp.]